MIAVMAGVFVGGLLVVAVCYIFVCILTEIKGVQRTVLLLNEGLGRAFEQIEVLANAKQHKVTPQESNPSRVI